MHTPTQADIMELTQREREICVSLYLPVPQSGAEMQRDKILARNNIKTAKELLLVQGWSAMEVDELMHPGEQLLMESQFAEENAKGVGIFLAPRFMRSYALPFAVETRAVVAHHFYIMPLLMLGEFNQSFYILAFSRNQVRLVHGTQSRVTQVISDVVPENLQDALGSEISEKQGGFRPLPASVGGGNHQAIFYGQGAGPDDKKDELVRYLRVIDQNLNKHLEGRTEPLVLAAASYLFPLYHEANTYPHLMKPGIPGNPEHKAPEQLRREAWEIVQPQFKRVEHAARDKFSQWLGTGVASCDLEEVVPAAFDGRIGTLFVTRGLLRWGNFDMVSRKIFLKPDGGTDGEELLNLAAIHTLANGGNVYSLDRKEMPAEATIAALFRY
jgi:hypothetical protein